MLVLACMFDLQDTLLELLCEVVESSVRQGKGLVISGFPRDLRRAEEYEAKVRGQTGNMWNINDEDEKASRHKLESCAQKRK